MEMVNEIFRSMKFKKNKAAPLSELIGSAVDPICAKRGFSSAALISVWPDIVGNEYENHSLPIEIIWPKQRNQIGNSDRRATLSVVVSPSKCLYFQHDAPQILERINHFLGYQAIDRLKIVQSESERTLAGPQRRSTPIDEQTRTALRESVSKIEEESLRDSLVNLGAVVKQGRD